MKKKFISRTSWREKIDKPQDVKIVKVPPRMSRFGSGTMLIPTPKLIDAMIRMVPKGKVVTVSELRRKLARDFRTDVTCPLTTGIFVRIAAEAAEEDRANGKKRIAPYWRVIKDDGSMNPNFPGGPAQQSRYLSAEGFAVANKGKTPRVQDFDGRLFQFK